MIVSIVKGKCRDFSSVSQRVEVVNIHKIHEYIDLREKVQDDCHVYLPNSAIFCYSVISNYLNIIFSSVFFEGPLMLRGP